jgi:hypothetical protein
MGDEADADWQAGLSEWGAEDGRLQRPGQDKCMAAWGTKYCVRCYRYISRRGQVCRTETER